MANLTHESEVKVIVRCSVCGCDLDEVSDREETVYRSFSESHKRHILECKPCAMCIEDTKGARSSEVDSLTVEIAELTAELEELRNG